MFSVGVVEHVYYFMLLSILLFSIVLEMCQEEGTLLGKMGVCMYGCVYVTVCVCVCVCGKSERKVSVCLCLGAFFR